MNVALTIAGSDSGGGAGIQADLKTFEAHGVFGVTAITSITAQNTLGVHRVFALPPDLVLAQLEAVFDDFTIAAVKVGMLLSADVAEVVAGVLRHRAAGIPIVLDPVMVSSSGERLMRDETIGIFLRELIPLATLITPNVPEGAVLAGREIATFEDMIDALPALHALGAGAVLLKGGHITMRLEDVEGEQSTDLLYDNNGCIALPAPYINTRNTHGTGCTLSSAIAANLANGLPLTAAVERAKGYVHNAIANAPGLGHGKGPLRHGRKV